MCPKAADGFHTESCQEHASTRQRGPFVPLITLAWCDQYYLFVSRSQQAVHMRFLVGIVSAKMSLVGVSSLPLVPEAFDRRYGSPSGVHGLEDDS